MECREVRQLAETLANGQPLPADTEQPVAAHLDHCPACRAAIEELRRLRAATRSAVERHPDLTPSPAFRAALTARLQHEAARLPARPSMAPGAASPQAARAFRRRQWLAIAASLVLMAGTAAGWLGWSSAALTALMHAAVGDHRFCALSFKLNERPIPLAEAARRYGGVYGRLEAIEPAATALPGGSLKIVERHACVYDGRRFAHIVLRYKNETVSLLVSDDPRPGDALWARLAAASATFSAWPAAEGFQVASLTRERHAVFVVSSLDAGDVQEVARVMAAPVARALSGT